MQDNLLELSSNNAIPPSGTLLTSDQVYSSQNKPIELKRKKCNRFLVFLSTFILLIFIIILLRTKPKIFSSSINTLLLDNADINKSLLDPNTYRIIKLSNGLQVTLISVPDESLARASIAVGTGSTADEDFHGLAHLTGHILAYGSKTYPDIITLSDHLSMYSGQFNAMTREHFTTFCIDLNSTIHDGFSKALDIFSKMFTEPLLSSMSINWEALVIQDDFIHTYSDNQKRLQVITNIIGELINKTYFTCGNYNTLTHSGIEVLERKVKEFIDKYYIASNMRLALLSGDNLDILESYAEKYFGSIRTKPELLINNDTNININEANNTSNDSRLIELSPIFRLGYIGWFKTLLSYNVVDYIFALPVNIDNKENPIGYINYLLSDNKKGSLIYDLKEHDWLENHYFGIYRKYNTYQEFIISLYLTDDAFNEIYLVFYKVFSFIKMLKKSFSISNSFNEYQNVLKHRYVFSSPTNDQTQIAYNMLNHKEYDYSDILSGRTMTEYDESIISNFFEYFSPINCLILLGSDHIETIEPFLEMYSKDKNITEFLLEPKTDPWYDTAYNYAQIKKVQLNILKNSKNLDNYSIRQQNPFLSNLFELVKCNATVAECEEEKKEIRPSLIVNTSNCLFFHRLDRGQLKPGAFAYFNIIIPHIRTRDPNHTNQILLYGHYIQIEIAERLQYATDAGNTINYTFTSADGIEISIYAYTDVMEKILSEITEIIFYPIITSSKYKNICQLITEKYISLQTKTQAYHYNILKNNHSEINGLITDSFEVMQESIAEMPSHLIIDALFYGNINNETVKSIYHNLFEPHLLPNDTLIQSQLNVSNATEVMKYLRHHHKVNGSFILRWINETEDNHLIMNSYQLGAYDINNTLLGYILKAIRGNQFYDILKTKKQLGYIVSEEVSIIDDMMYQIFFIQGKLWTPNEMNKEIDDFIMEMYDQLKNLTEEDLEKYKKMFLPKHNIPKHELCWNQIKKRTYEFNRYDYTDALKKITKARLIEYFEGIYFTDIHKISIQLYASNDIQRRFFSPSYYNENYGLNNTFISYVYSDIEELKKAIINK